MSNKAKSEATRRLEELLPGKSFLTVFLPSQTSPLKTRHLLLFAELAYSTRFKGRALGVTRLAHALRGDRQATREQLRYLAGLGLARETSKGWLAACPTDPRTVLAYFQRRKSPEENPVWIDTLAYVRYYRPDPDGPARGPKRRRRDYHGLTPPEALTLCYLLSRGPRLRFRLEYMGSKLGMDRRSLKAVLGALSDLGLVSLEEGVDGYQAEVCQDPGLLDPFFLGNSDSAKKRKENRATRTRAESHGDSPRNASMGRTLHHWVVEESEKIRPDYRDRASYLAFWLLHRTDFRDAIDRVVANHERVNRSSGNTFPFARLQDYEEILLELVLSWQRGSFNLLNVRGYPLDYDQWEVSGRPSRPEPGLMVVPMTDDGYPRIKQDDRAGT